jgi:hypothetical protein
MNSHWSEWIGVAMVVGIIALTVFASLTTR